MSALNRHSIVGLRGLHLLARIALRIRTPLQAKAFVDRTAAHLPALTGVEDARAAMRVLYPTGSCLSRALTVAAALPGAEVVIGVDAWSAARLSAHAWLELGDVRVDTIPGNSQVPDVLARLAPAIRRVGGPPPA